MGNRTQDLRITSVSRALLVGPMPALASGSLVAAGDDHWLLVTVRGQRRADSSRFSRSQVTVVDRWFPSHVARAWHTEQLVQGWSVLVAHRQVGKWL